MYLLTHVVWLLLNPAFLSGPKTQIFPSVQLIYCDNQSVIVPAMNPESYAQSKHFNILEYYQGEKIEDRAIEFKFIPTEQQIADGLTKALTEENFLVFRRDLGLEKYRSFSESGLFLLYMLKRKCGSPSPLWSTERGMWELFIFSFCPYLWLQVDTRAC